MKTILVAAFTLVIGFAIGTFYGWRTGVVDGRILTSEMPLALVELYGQSRATNDIPSRDRAIDALSMGLGVNFAVENDLSPLAYFLQPKADCGLLDIAACWQLDHPGSDQHLFPPGSPSDTRLSQVMAKYGGYYEITLKRQTDQREKAKEQKQ